MGRLAQTLAISNFGRLTVQVRNLHSLAFSNIRVFWWRTNLAFETQQRFGGDWKSVHRLRFAQWRTAPGQCNRSPRIARRGALRTLHKPLNQRSPGSWLVAKQCNRRRAASPRNYSSFFGSAQSPKVAFPPFAFGLHRKTRSAVKGNGPRSLLSAPSKGSVNVMAGTS